LGRLALDCQVLTDGTVICEQTYGFWIQTGAIVVSALAAIGLLFYTLAIARKRATVDLVMQQKLDKDLVDARNKFRPLRRKETSFISYADNPDAPQNKFLQIVLNAREFEATGIREGAFDEKIFKRMVYNTVIKDWDSLKPYVMELRRKRNHQTLFQEFEWLATRWEKNPLKKNF
jgi:hypothetical protein